MPSHYAHHRFGKDVLPSLPADRQRLIQRFRRLYNIGLQGPDLFFYHSPFWETETGKLGKTFHRTSGREFFTRSCDILRKNPTEGGTAFLYGLLAHYCLDSRVHPFVHALTDEGPIGHVELEVEFDRHLLTLDGKIPPQTHRMSKYYKITRGECVTAAAFYPPATPGAIHLCTRNMMKADWFLKGKNRKLLRNLLKVTPSSVAQQLMADPANHKCLHLNETMLEHYSAAVSLYTVLQEQLTACLRDGTPLGEEFEAVFG